MIQHCGRKLRVLLTMPGEELDRSSNFAEKLFA